MANSVAVMVGESKEWLPEIVERASKLVLGSGTDPKSEMGPLAYADLKKRVVSLLDTVE